VRLSKPTKLVMTERSKGRGGQSSEIVGNQNWHAQRLGDGLDAGAAASANAETDGFLLALLLFSKRTE